MTMGFAAKVCAACLAVSTLAACGTTVARPSATTSATPQEGAGRAAQDATRYTANATVLQNPQHGPQLCMAVMTSLPPQCGGPDIVGWDWSKVQSQERQGVRWGEYHVTGTWDGKRLTLTEPAGPQVETPVMPPSKGRFASPCPEPQGGWHPVDPSAATMETQEQAIQRAQSVPEFAGAWVDQSYLDGLPTGMESTAANDPAKLVLNLRFTGDLSGREAWIREVWGGALCVTGAERSEASLRKVADALPDDLRSGLDLQALETSVDTVGNKIDLTVYVVTPRLRGWLDDKYGPGMVEVDGFLKPVA
ncbi:hypothetical protein J5X84_27345 [Streptosporangiaceae bacterium NEAU-GS5]|nr:hypothetical protein [Streptosporangiaceae bacterium NEAU-GS5]